jgi:two-component system LytT family response regulator
VTLRVLVVDDEPLARRRLRRLLQGSRGVEVVRECGDGPSAVAAVTEFAPDVLLLDVQMPGMDGFEVLNACRVAPLPEVIFVTAYDRYAVRAFEHHALDYLLKPVAPERLAAALTHARRRLTARRPNPRARRVDGLLSDAGEVSPVQRLLVQERERSYFVRTDDIDYLESDGNYVWAHTAQRRCRVRATLASLAGRLNPEHFRRISRTCVVNVDRIREIQPWFHGDAVVILQSGQRLRLSRTRRHELLRP